MDMDKIREGDAERMRVDNILHKMQPDHGGANLRMFSIPQELERLTKENDKLRAQLKAAGEVVEAARRVVNVSRNGGIERPYPELQDALQRCDDAGK